MWQSRAVIMNKMMKPCYRVILLPKDENAMTMDIAMGGSTNTILHLLAVANEAGVNFKMKDIDCLSRTVPCLCKPHPTTTTIIWKTYIAQVALSAFWKGIG